jgi:hypothetical protein
MKLHLHFISVNTQFDHKLADDLFEGQETEDNIKHLWEDDMTVSEDVKEYKILNNENYVLAGFFPDGKPFSYVIPEMTLCNAYTQNGATMQFAVSKKILKKTEKVEDASGTHLYFYLSDHHPMINPMNGVYIFKKDFPAELKKTE